MVRLRERRPDGKPGGRRWALLVVVATAVGVCGGSLAAPLVIQSPAQQAAHARPPAATVLTAPVEYRVLKSAVVMRGTVTPASSIDVNASGGPAEGKPVITGVRVKKGGTVAPGQVIMEISGRPVIAMPGAVPAYRDLRPGVSGKDVAQLQAALMSLGFDPGAHDGVFGEGTKKAVAALYASLGYTAPTTGDQDRQALESARRQLREAERAAQDAQAAQHAQAAPAQHVGQATHVAHQPTATPAASAGPSSPSVVNPDGDLRVDRAMEDLADARKAVANLEATTGPMLPVGEIVFVPGFPARVTAVKAKVGAEPEAPLLTLSAGK